MNRAAIAIEPNLVELRRDAVAERLSLFGLSLPALALVTVILVIPVGWLFGLSFLADDGSLSGVNYARMLREPSYVRILLATFEISAMTTLICVLLGYPLAYVLSQLPRRVANLFRGRCHRRVPPPSTLQPLG